MRQMSSYLVIHFCLTLLLGHAKSASADELELRNGQVMKDASVLEYANGYVKVRTSDGQITSGKISAIKRIRFSDPAADANAKPAEGSATQKSDEEKSFKPIPPALLPQLEVKVEEAKRMRSAYADKLAIVTFMLELPDPSAKLHRNVEYRCYSGSGGYSGMRTVEVDTPWAESEILRTSDGARRIEIDAGPPYEVININTQLSVGKVTELGIIKLTPVKATQAVAITGVVKDTRGNPLPDMTVRGGSKNAKSDSQGRYRIEGFGLEVVDLSVAAEKYFHNPTLIEIRNTEKSEIEKDLILFGPQKIKFKFVVSDRLSDSFDGPKVQTGEFTVTVDSANQLMDELQFGSTNFTEFVQKSSLKFDYWTGQLTIGNSYAPIFYKTYQDEDSDSIITAPEIPYNNQRCQPLAAGQTIIMRGFEHGKSKGVTDFCVKLQVLEMTEIE